MENQLKRLHTKRASKIIICVIILNSNNATKELSVSNKRVWRSFENVFKDKIRLYNKCNTRRMRDTTSVNCSRIMKSIAQSILAVAINAKDFQNHGILYLHNNQVDISIYIGYILVNMAKTISKWMKYDLQKYF